MIGTSWRGKLQNVWSLADFVPCFDHYVSADLKRAEGTKKSGDSDSDNDRPKKKTTKGTNGKSKNKR